MACIRRSPAFVGETLRVVRVSRRIFRRFSSPETVWLRADCVTPKRAAARVKLPSLATVTKARRSFKLCRGIGACLSQLISWAYNFNKLSLDYQALRIPRE